MSDKTMTSEEFCVSVIGQAHVTAQDALSTAITIFGRSDRHVAVLRGLGQLTLAIRNEQWDEAARQLAKIREAYGEGVTT